MKFGFRFSFPEGDFDTTDPISGNVELAFVDPSKFLNLNLNHVVQAFKSINLASIHLPHVRITDRNVFTECLTRSIKLAKSLGCDILVVHPSKAKMNDEIRKLLEEIALLLEKERIFLAWETFTGKSRLFNRLEQIAELSEISRFYCICYDTSHVKGDTDDVIQELSSYIEFIKVIHASNRTADHKKQHLPVFSNEGVLDFHKIFSALSQVYDGYVILEYLPEFHSQIQKDLKELNRPFRS